MNSQPSQTAYSRGSRRVRDNEMGCGTEVVCLTCQTRFDCGYGSYGTYCERLALFDAARHEGHEFFDHCEDSDCYEGDDLHQMGAYGICGELLAKGWAKMRIVHLRRVAAAPSKESK